MKSNSTNGVLISIKVLQLIGSITCLVLHIILYMMYYDTPHITVFCGTYMGFTLVNMSFLISATMGKPTAEELDMALGVLGGILFYVCGLLGMYFVRQYSDKYEGDPVYFNLARSMSMISLLTALIFVFDACLKFDMWNYKRNKRKDKKSAEDSEPPPLRLFCVDICHFCYKKCRCCDCCNSCCEKMCKCCRPKDEDADSSQSIPSRVSESSKENPPTITIEKYRDSTSSQGKHVVQRVEIEWDSKPVMFPKSMGDIADSRAEKDKQDLANTPSFFVTQKLTWPLPLHSMIRSELSLSSRSSMQRIARTSRMLRDMPREIPESSSSSHQEISEMVIPTVSFEPEIVDGLQRSLSPSSTSLLPPGGVKEEENKAEDDACTTKSNENILPEHADPTSSSSQGSMIVRSRSTKKQ